MTRFARRRDGSEEQRTTFLELFFDLVFVFAVTQVSQLLLHDLSWRGAGRATIALLVVWWAWNYTTWVTNELDPDRGAVRLLLLALALGSLLLAVAIPEAFHGRAWLFAAAYVAIQVGRHGFLTYVSAGRGTIERERAKHILIWAVASGVLWLGGAAAGGGVRIALWLGALALDYGAPLVLYRVPGLPRLDGSTWEVETAHFAERFQLFVIIALGESVVVIGATTADLHLGAERVAAFVLGFGVTAGLWWLYFDYVGRIAQRRLEEAPNRTILARDGYTYLHVVLIAGIIVAAVGNELVIAHPGETLPGRELAAIAGGPAIYLLGHVLVRLRLAGSVSWKRTAGAVACVAAGGVGAVAPGLAVAALVVAILAGLVVAERVAGAGRARGAEATPPVRLATGESGPIPGAG